MKRTIHYKTTLHAAGLMTLVAASYFVPVSAAPKDQLCAGIGGCTGGDAELKEFIGKITDVLAFLAGAVAVIMIIIGGIRYIMSNGEQSHITAAKNTILYSVIGLIVVVAAYAIVKFIVSSL